MKRQKKPRLALRFDEARGRWTITEYSTYGFSVLASYDTLEEAQAAVKLLLKMGR